jgi:hypothetical protein
LRATPCARGSGRWIARLAVQLVGGVEQGDDLPRVVEIGPPRLGGLEPTVARVDLDGILGDQSAFERDVEYRVEPNERLVDRLVAGRTSPGFSSHASPRDLLALAHHPVAVAVDFGNRDLAQAAVLEVGEQEAGQVHQVALCGPAPRQALTESRGVSSSDHGMRRSLSPSLIDR